jgi:hypothetical protein
MDITLVLSKYYSGQEWSLNGEDYNNLVWHSETPKPNLEELKTKWAEYLIEKEATKYKELRKADYPPIADQLDAMFHNFDSWKAMIQAVKDKHPKPIPVVVEEEIPEVIPEQPHVEESVEDIEVPINEQ